MTVLEVEYYRTAATISFFLNTLSKLKCISEHANSNFGVYMLLTKHYLRPLV